MTDISVFTNVIQHIEKLIKQKADMIRHNADNIDVCHMLRYFPFIGLPLLYTERCCWQPCDAAADWTVRCHVTLEARSDWARSL